MNNIRKKILGGYPSLNSAQREAIFHSKGPLLIIAGPGTGKTLVLALRALYLIFSDKASPSEIILTTFTEKAAFELRDRVSQIAKSLDLKGNLHEIKIGTIHSICDSFISQFLSYTPLGKNYVVLDRLTQYLFIFDNFSNIVDKPSGGSYLGRWSSKWETIKKLAQYFNKITEELIDPRALLKSKKEFLKQLSVAYIKYKKFLIDKNRVDFAHLQKIFLDLLENKEVYPKIKKQIKYIMIDEYQDTNYIQEKIALTLSRPEHNICVVGDEDQALYRFRGATVRNILEFPNHFKDCKIIKLQENYRSHKNIIAAYNKFITSISWNDKGGKFYRYPDKTVVPSKTTNSSDYPAVFSIWTKDEKDEAERLANMIDFLKENKVIKDYSDVALLLTSVRLYNSGHYIEALKRHNIPFYNPRAKAYFENTEIKLLLACYAIIFGFYGEPLSTYSGKEYIEDGIKTLGQFLRRPIADYLKRKATQIESLKEGESLNLTPGDYFYQLLAYKPFSDFLSDENQARNLSIFSQLLNTFQSYYHVSVITYKNKHSIKLKLFNSFLNFLLRSGLDEFEDPDNPLPKGHVQVMTIHQSKGLEFPVVIVGTLDKSFRSQKQLNRDLSPFYLRKEFEPENKVTLFDGMRRFYVAFSRAQKLLVLTAHADPKPYFKPIWEGLDQWPYVKKKTLKAQSFSSKLPFIPRKTYGLTSHINVYETCPRQYLFYKEYKFQPLRAGQILFGTLVHETIEDIHHMVLDGKVNEINDSKIKEFFNQNYKSLLTTGMRPLAETTRERAFKQVFTYFKQNQDLLSRVKETEVDVSVEKGDYIIVGKIDLILGKDGKLEILDFKTQPKPAYGDPIIDRYKKQLSLYAYVLKKRYNKDPERLYIYWTSEEKRKNALMEVSYDNEAIKEAGDHFDEVVKEIEERKFEIKKTPNIKTCKECDFRFLCAAEGIINLKAEGG